VKSSSFGCGYAALCIVVDKLCKDHNLAKAFDEATKISDLYKEVRQIITA